MKSSKYPTLIPYEEKISLEIGNAEILKDERIMIETEHDMSYAWNQAL